MPLRSFKFIKYKTLNISKNYVSYLQIYRYLRGERLKKLYRDSAKLDKILSNFSCESETLKKTELCQENISTVKSNREKENRTEKKIVKPPRISSKPEPVSNEIVVTAENQFDELSKIVTPLYELPYDVQLRRKFNANVDVLHVLGKELSANGIKIPEGSNYQACVLDPIIPSPITESYRNKDEFSIRTGVDGNPKTVGFFLEKTNQNSETICVGPDKLVIIKDSHKLVSKEFENYIRQSPLPACHNFSDGGHWRNIIVRSNTQGDIMAIVVIHPQNLSEEQIEEEKEKLKDYFLKKKEFLNIKSFYFQACSHTRCTHAQAPFQLLFGEPYIFEKIDNVKFRISPEAFFQINTSAANLLYKVILHTCKASKSSTILDICCGIGPISLTMAQHVKNCIGVDNSIEAIEDARANAEMNGIKNVEFHSGRSEFLIRDILNDIYAEDLIAVVNPARGPLNKTIMSAFRECKHLKNIVFVSCKPKNAIPNFVHLCKSGEKYCYGSRFHAIRAVPVDLFPHTLHSELIILFKRIS